MLPRSPWLVGFVFKDRHLCYTFNLVEITAVRHVVLPGTPEHETLEHRNITEHSGKPKKPETPQENPKIQKADGTPICYRALELL